MKMEKNQNLKRSWLISSRGIKRILTHSLKKIWKICSLVDCFWPKYVMFELKNYRGVMFDGVNIDAKFGGKLFCAFKNDMRNLAKIQRLKSSDSILENKTKSK